MKYIVYAFNYPTLCRALRYIDSQWGKENSILIFAELVSPLPEAIKEEYHATVIRGYNRSKFGGVKGLVADIAITHASCHAIKQAIRSFDGEFTLVVFRDNEVQEATIIERVFKRYSDRCHLWIIEEGVGLYRTDRNPIHYLPIKRILFPILGLSRYALKNVSQGEHPKIEQVICSRPDLASTKFCNKILVKQIDVFTHDFNKHFCSLFFQNKNPSFHNANFVLLTTLIFEIIGNGREQYALYKEFLDKTCSLVSNYGSLIIKPHPRDTYDYSSFCTSTVRVCSMQENKLPFECLYDYYGQPQVLSLGSSASINLVCSKPTIFISGLLGFEVSTAKILQNGDASNDVIICNTYTDLERALSNTPQSSAD